MLRPRPSIVLPLLFLGSAIALRGSEPAAESLEFFEKKVRPVLVKHCFKCHAGEERKGGLRLDSRAGWTQGGDSGPALVPGNPDESLLIQAVRYGGDYEMPPTGRLPDAIIADLEQWVRMGAPDPRVSRLPAANTQTPDLEAGRRHWAYRPVVDAVPPAVRDASWPATTIDRFVLARLEEVRLRPAADASREVLVRRLYLDLIGLPPTPEQIAGFEQDASADAYQRLVDRLLASPHFGQRWGRHWLDVARFAESLTLRGFVMKEAWRYRDYVIDAFNADWPYDQFLREQIAGDLLTADAIAERQRRRIATTFLMLGNTNLEEQDKQQLEMDVIDEQLDVISKGLLAQTVTCARCHDHKFDPIPTRDYYALAGILKNVKSLEHANVSKWIEVPLPIEAEREVVYQSHDTAVAALQQKIKAAKADLAAQSAAASPPTVTSVSPDTLPGIVVDDADARRVGQWQESQHNKRYIGRGYLHDQNAGQGEKTLTFAPELPRDGRYEVRFAYTAGTNRDRHVAVTVFSAEGEVTKHVDQREQPPIDGHFVSLGQFRFERAGQSFVIVSNEGATGHVIADAVQFLPVEPAAATLSAAAAAPPGSPSRPSAAATELKRLEGELKKLTERAPYRPAAMSVVEQSTISDARISIRGSIHQLGPVVPRGFLQVCSPAATDMPADQSGRRELADWIASPENPLTARVMANRIWHWLFGAGLVRSVDNFGTTGEAPSHPELLDYLARQFVDGGWSVKSLVREMVLSRTYRQHSIAGGVEAGSAVSSDADNRLLARSNHRRLDAEALRDAMLLVSGQLRLEMGGPDFSQDLSSDYGFQQSSSRRSVYCPVFRNALPEMLEVFDFADPSVVSGRRNISTVAPQALLMMNHPFVLQQSRYAAQRLLAECHGTADSRIATAFQWTIGRAATEAELRSALEFVRHTAEHSAATLDEERWIGAYAQLFQSLFASIDFRYLK